MDLFEQLSRFRATHPLTGRCIAGHDWAYIRCGAGADTIILLPGGLGIAETSFQYIMAFEPDYRVLSLTYPATARCVGDLVHGMAGLMHSERIERAHVIGGSYSGMIAQCFARRYPAFVGSLILSHAGVPSRSRVRSFELYARVLSSRSIGPMRAFVRLANRAAFFSSHPIQSFWKAYFEQLINTISAESLQSLFHVMLDFDRNYVFTAQDAAHLHGETLIVDSEHDRYISAQERAALRALYPGARTHRFAGHGHSSPLENAEAYIAVYRDFIHPPTASGAA